MRTSPLLLAACLALPAAARAETPRLKVPLERYQLSNGLTVILHEDHRVPTVVVNLWFHVGSKDEAAKRTGFAHLFEHLMFMGTKAVPNGQFDSIMEAAGGANNATTSEDRTNYFESGPANLLETFLWLEADRLSTLPDDMTKDKVDLQRDVVKNERRQSYENRPYGMVELAMPEHMYPEGHPYHHPVIGSHEDLTAASVDDVKAFFRSYYVPSNASLVIAGDFQAAAAKKLVERYFGWMPKQPVPPHATPPAARLARSEEVTLPDAVELARVELAFHSPAAYGPGDAESDVLATVLGTGKSSRLYRALVYDKKVAQAVSVEQRGSRHGGLLVVTATAQPGHDALELERALEAELKAARSSPPTAREVERAKANLQTQVLRNVDRVNQMADMLNAFQFFLGDPRLVETELLARYERVSPADVARQAEAILGQPRLSIRVVPRKAKEEPAKAATTKGGAR